jgi:hypothetical protein
VVIDGLIQRADPVLDAVAGSGDAEGLLGVMLVSAHDFSTDWTDW